MQGRAVLMLIVCVQFAACGGKGSTTPSGTNSSGTTTGGTTNTSSKKVTATITPIATVQGQTLPPVTNFTATLATGTYLSGAFGVGGTNATSSLNIALLTTTGVGTYDLGPGNPHSATARWIDPTGDYVAGVGGSGTLVVTVAVLGRVAGTFDFIGNYIPAGIGSNQQLRVRVVGSFDVTTP